MYMGCVLISQAGMIWPEMEMLPNRSGWPATTLGMGEIIWKAGFHIPDSLRIHANLSDLCVFGGRSGIKPIPGFVTI